MATRGIDELIWTAFTDSTFRERLLDGQCREVLATANLTEAERQAVLAVKADTLQDLARALCQPEPSGA